MNVHVYYNIGGHRNPYNNWIMTIFNISRLSHTHYKCDILSTQKKTFKI